MQSAPWIATERGNIAPHANKRTLSAPLPHKAAIGMANEITDQVKKAAERAMRNENSI